MHKRGQTCYMYVYKKERSTYCDKKYIFVSMLKRLVLKKNQC